MSPSGTNSSVLISVDIDLYRVKIERLIGKESVIYLTDSLAESDCHYFTRCLRQRTRQPLAIVMACMGGDVATAARMVEVVQAYSSEWTCLLAGPSTSAGTLLAACADSIIFSGHAYLTPVDPQIYTLASGNGAPRALSSEEIRLIPNLLRDWFRMNAADVPIDIVKTIFGQVFAPTLVSLYRAEKQVLSGLESSLTGGRTTEEAATIAHDLVRNYHAHQTAISYKGAAALGLPASSASPELDEVLCDLFEGWIDAQANGGANALKAVLAGGQFLAERKSQKWSGGSLP